MKLHVLDRSGDWAVHTPYFLFKAGAMQGWVDMYKVVSEQEYGNGQYDFAEVPFVSDLYENPAQTQTPAAPALEFKLEMDGTATPSTENASVLPKLNQEDKNLPWSSDVAKKMVEQPTSDHNAPNMGEFNDLIPSMYLDFDPNIKSAYDYIVIISMETRNPNDILVNPAARATRFDSRNYTANQYRGTAQFQLVTIVKMGCMKGAVKSLDDLKLRDKDGDLITQEWLDHILSLMNGGATIEDPDNPTAVKFTGRNLQDRINIVSFLLNES